jgi:tellurite resistance protein
MRWPWRVPPNLYLRLSFGPGFWAIAFSYAAAATLALEWISITRPPGATTWTVLVLVLITGFIGVIAVRTALLALRGQLLPAATRTARSVHVA